MKTLNPSRSDYLKLLRKFWGFGAFRPLQEEIIHSICKGKDTLGLLPTGGGKSLTFQLPGMLLPGVCLVITPLIALMKDQVHHLRQKGIGAAAIHTGMSREEILTALENCIFGDYKFLYLSPERLSTDLFQAKLKALDISFITVDECHCISQWGYDFRPAYLKISELRDKLPGVPVLALTATATPQVVKDVQERLRFSEENVFSSSFARPNLRYRVEKVENKEVRLLQVLQQAAGSSIVYTRSRKKADDMALMLQQAGVSATSYHAGLENFVKHRRQKAWSQGEISVMVATNAFGMGIDKPDVRFVLHLDPPDAPEAYFQEAGRAGRDGRAADALLWIDNSDIQKMNKRVDDQFPPTEYVKKVYEDLQFFFQMAMGDGIGCRKQLDLQEFCRRFKHFPVRVESALRLLTYAGYLEYLPEDQTHSRLHVLVGRDRLYAFIRDDAEEDVLVTAVMRLYPGLFSDYVYVSERKLSDVTGLNPDRVYNILKSLDARGVLSYIPEKRMPAIRYMRERLETHRLHFPSSVYQDRREKFISRLEAMKKYITDSSCCRVQQLLGYFGEAAKSCSTCDVCSPEPRMEKLIRPDSMNKSAVTAALDEGPASLVQLCERTGLSETVLKSQLRKLYDEGEITVRNSLIQWRHKS